MQDEGVWRTISGHRVFISKDGIIHSKNKALDGKKLSKEGKKIIKEDEKRNEDISFTSNVKKEELMKKYNIEDWEQKMINDYTGVNYGSINDQLRKYNGDVSKCSLDVQNDCEGIDNVLKKLPKFEGIVHRKESSGREDVYKEGETYTNHSYTSTSAWSDMGGGTILEIKQSSGCNISKFSRSPGENEVLLPRGFTYKVTKVEKTSSGYTKVYAEEVKNGEKEEKNNK